MSEDDPATAHPPVRRARMSKEERRRQLVGIGLGFLTERPIQEVSLDSVADAAGISRGLIFHYFPSKTAFHEAVVRAAGRRVVRNVAPDDGATGEAAVRQILERFIAQVERRRAAYLALVQGNLADLGGREVAGSLRECLTEMIMTAMQEAGRQPPECVVHAWLAYVEDIAIRWSDPTRAPRDGDVGDIADHAQVALAALSDAFGPAAAASPAR